MTPLVNEFTWSRRRDEVFVACPRQYHCEYYGSWNGWLAEAPPRTRLIYVLKQLKTRHMWAGDAVHRAIARTLENLRRGIEPLPGEEIIRLVLDEMRAGFRSSRDGLYRQRPKTLALYEHEYAEDVPDEEWRRTVDGALGCLRTFYASGIYRELGALPRADWLEIEQLSSFELDGVKIWVKLDCSHRDGPAVRVLDWKTGRVSGEDQTVQLGCYALYGVLRWGTAPGDVRMAEFNLAHNELLAYTVSEESLEGVKNYIRGSVADMRRLLVDAAANAPRPEEEFALAPTEEPCRRCKYRRVCPRFA